MEPRAPRRRPRVLIVEDDPRALAALCESLRRAGLDAVGAGSAEEALPQARQGLDGALIDAHLPGRSGPDLCTILRGMPEVRDAVIYLLSGGDPNYYANASESRAADGFLTKPVDPRRLAALFCVPRA